MDCILQQINNSVCVFHRYNHSILNIKKICANLYKHNILLALYIILFYYSHQTKEESCYPTRYIPSICTDIEYWYIIHVHTETVQCHAINM